LNDSSVVIISDDPEFARTLTGRWQTERHIPEITVATSDVWGPATIPDCDIVIVGPVRRGDRSAVLHRAMMAGVPVITLTSDEKELAPPNSKSPNLVIVPEHDGWPTTLILLATEMLRRVDAVSRAQRAERLALISQRHAALGRYMLEVRPSVNNALTSVLGNADLLLIDPDEVSANRREQLRAIHTMALRLNEIIQRFSSLATEMWAGENASQIETEMGARPILTRSSTLP
jgi:signal transduction histidine kinase